VTEVSGEVVFGGAVLGEGCSIWWFHNSCSDSWLLVVVVVHASSLWWGR